jgi:hypothetical protein
MTTELTTTENLPVNKYHDEKSWGEIATATSFLKRIQLYTASSPSIAAGLIGPGKFGLVHGKENIEDLTTALDCLPIAWRFKAMEFGEALISAYNPQSAQFKDIQAKSETPDSQCSYGIEFLLWLPNQKLFVTYFMNSKTSRRVAPDVKNNLLKPTTIKSNLIKRGKQSWHGPVVTVCSTPFAMPDAGEVHEQAERFANPKESEVEAAEPSGRAQ